MVSVNNVQGADNLDLSKLNSGNVANSDPKRSFAKELIFIMQQGSSTNPPAQPLNIDPLALSDVIAEAEKIGIVPAEKAQIMFTELQAITADPSEADNPENTMKIREIARELVSLIENAKELTNPYEIKLLWRGVRAAFNVFNSNLSDSINDTEDPDTLTGGIPS